MTDDSKTLKQYARICARVQQVLTTSGMRQAWPAAIAAGVSPKTVTEHLRRGNIPGVLVDSRWLVPDGAIQAAVAAGVFTPGGRGKYTRKKKEATESRTTPSQ